MMHKALITGGALAVIFAGSAQARSIPNTGTPQSVQQLIACRSIAVSAAVDRAPGSTAVAMRFLHPLLFESKVMRLSACKINHVVGLFLIDAGRSSLLGESHAARCRQEL